MLSHMFKFSILFTPQKSDLGKWFAVAAVQQLFSYEEEASLPLAPGEEGPKGPKDPRVGGAQAVERVRGGDSLVVHL